MKISKSILQAIVVGVTLGTAATACDLVEAVDDIEIKKEQVCDDQEEGHINLHGENCPGCGMG